MKEEQRSSGIKKRVNFFSLKFNIYTEASLTPLFRTVDQLEFLKKSSVRAYQAGVPFAQQSYYYYVDYPSESSFQELDSSYMQTSL